MTHETNADPSLWTVRYPCISERRAVQRNLPYTATADEARTMDLYLPVDVESTPGVVIIASGYPRAGLERHFQRSAREFGAARSWGDLLATNGVAAIAYDAVDPITDLASLIDHVRSHADSLRIDASRMGLFACSGNVPVALAHLDTHVKCAALLYGFMLDGPNEDLVARAARQFGFAVATLPDGLVRIPASTRMLLVRAGCDAFTGLNAGIDSFVAQALARNLPITLVNHASAMHAFDLLDDGESTQRIIRDVVQFLKDGLA